MQKKKIAYIPSCSEAAYDSSKTITKQVNKQKQVLSGFVIFGSQDASNWIVVANDANACRQEDDGGGGGPGR